MQRKARKKTTPLRKLAREQDCQLRIPGVCNGRNDTTVLCHLNGGGIGFKSDDFIAAWGCSSCHSWVDGGYAKDSDRVTRDLYHLEGVVRTQQELINLGVITCSA